MRDAERERLSWQEAFDAGQTMAQRNVAGQFATPPELAAEVARVAAGFLECEEPVFGEPSAGSGAFIAALLSCGVRPAPGSWAVELNPQLAETCRRLWGPLGVEVATGDYCAMASRGADLILSNPPYVRHHHLERARKDSLRARVRESCGADPGGRAGLYVHFMFLATAQLRPGGIAAFLVPTEWMRVGYGGVLRRWLNERRVERVHTFASSDEQFGDALVSTSVLFVKNAPPGPDVPFSSGGTLERPDSVTRYTTAALAAAERWPPAGETDGPTLGDYFSVKRGVATGANDFFLMTRARAAELGLPKEVLRPALPSPRDLADPIIDDVGDLVLLDCASADEPAVAAYLAAGERSGLPERYLLSRRRPWYRQERRAPAPFVCAYMGRKTPLRVFWNRARLAATNRWLMLYPFAGLNERDAWELLRGLDPRDAQEHGRQYGGGLHKLEPSELLRLPVRPSQD